MSRRHHGKLRPLTRKDRLKKAAHNERTGRRIKIWRKQHVVG